MIKRIVCFANSRKPDGKCFAGKDLYNELWIRPIGNRQSESISPKEECISKNNCNCSYCCPKIPELLDIVEMELIQYAGYCHQSENYIIGPSRWNKIDQLDTKCIDKYLDFPCDGLWIDGFSSIHRKNDRIPVAMIKQLHDSLNLIEISQLDIEVVVEGLDYGHPRKRVNGIFSYKRIDYILPVTDEIIEKDFLHLEEGVYPLYTKSKRIVLCISMGKEYKGFIYKLISGIIEI